MLNEILSMLSYTLALQIEPSYYKEKLHDALYGVLQVVLQKVNSANDSETKSIILTHNAIL